jgi:hypothetical protein
MFQLSLTQASQLSLDDPANVVFLCDKVAVFGAMTKGTLIFLRYE